MISRSIISVNEINNKTYIANNAKRKKNSIDVHNFEVGI